MMRLESLLRAARAGEPRAWSRLAKALYEELHAYFRLRSSDDDAQDYAQSAVLVALEKLSTLESEVSLEGWIVGVARNLWRVGQRSKARRTRLHDELVALSDVLQIGLSTAAMRAQLVRILKEEIEKLPDKAREVFEHDLAEDDPQVLAERHGVARPTIRTWRAKGLRDLKVGVQQRTQTPQAAVSKLTAVSTPIPT